MTTYIAEENITTKTLHEMHKSKLVDHIKVDLNLDMIPEFRPIVSIFMTMINFRLLKKKKNVQSVTCHSFRQ